MKITELREKLTQKYLKERLDYDPATGVFHWKHHDSMPNSWNAKNAGKAAGSVTTLKGCYMVRRIVIMSTRVLEHHVAWFYMTGEWPHDGMVIDHKDQDPTNNSWDNIRLIKKSTNNTNFPRYRNNSSGHTGVYWVSDRQMWGAKVSLDKEHFYLGVYEDKDEAGEVVRKFRESHGFHANHGKERSEHTVEGNPLKRNNSSGCRYIRWVPTRGVWRVEISFNKNRHSFFGFTELEEAKKSLKEFLDAHPDHPYHGYPIP